MDDIGDVVCMYVFIGLDSFDCVFFGLNLLVDGEVEFFGGVK